MAAFWALARFSSMRESDSPRSWVNSMSRWSSSRSFNRSFSCSAISFGSGGGGPSGVSSSSGSGTFAAIRACLAEALGITAPVCLPTSITNCARCIRCTSVAMFGSDTGTTSQSPSA